MSLYTNGSPAVKWRPTSEFTSQPAPKPRLRLAGTVHKKGWAEQARAFRAVLKMIHSRSPLGVRGGSEHVAMEVIEHIDKLDARSLHLLRFVFAELHKLSNR
jgi:hypothetical protein